MMPSTFGFYRTPSIHFGPGLFERLPALAARYGKKALVVTGGSSLNASGRLDQLLSRLKGEGIRGTVAQATAEPSPELVDEISSRYRPEGIDVVIAVGGGSSIDTGKSVAAMLRFDDSVAEYLEGVGSKKHPGTKLPFIAVPTTAGTGSEATTNAVLSRVGANGFKQSLRHENFTPDVALVDPTLMLSCPSEITAACGMDALSQLLESYVSLKATPFTDALGKGALKALLEAIVPACTSGSTDIGVRSSVAYAALVSGVTLANAGLGIIHGIASPLGAHFPIPHGVACGTILAPAVRITIEKLGAGGNEDALRKFADVGALIDTRTAGSLQRGCDALVAKLYDLTDCLALPRLGHYGVTASNLDSIVAGASNKNNPAALAQDDVRALLEERL